MLLALFNLAFSTARVLSKKSISRTPDPVIKYVAKILIYFDVKDPNAFRCISPFPPQSYGKSVHTYCNNC